MHQEIGMSVAASKVWVTTEPKGNEYLKRSLYNCFAQGTAIRLDGIWGDIAYGAVMVSLKDYSE